ncbi:MAG: prepilin-type N-terminal cleavage/methylation domain-containing protein [Bdellovibrio sp.]|nr:prepilin-type N-terminal cleavage/methylation domain-containing protein [Bdellovibrio sp.]
MMCCRSLLFFKLIRSVKPNRRKSYLSKGFSLTEILVALGLVSIIGAGLAAVMSSAAKQQKGIQAKDQQREISAEIRSLLSKSAACKYSFNGGDPAAPGFSADAIKDENNVDRYNKTDKSTDKSGLLKFTDFKVLVSPSDPSNADLTVLLSKIGDVGTVREIRPDNIKLRIKLNGSGLITDCIAIGTVTDGFWQIGVPNPNDIYFSAGNVGIGTTSPAATLDVNGSIRPGSSATVTACGMGAANGEGTMRYNYGTHKMEYCDGTTWSPSGAATCTMVSASVPSGGGGVTCPATYQVTGGGCQPATGGTVTATTPTGNGWACSGSSSSGTISATAICCK